MGPLEIALLVGAGDGGSLLSVSLLVLLGYPGTLANGTNRVGILVANAAAAWRFRAEGVPGMREAMPLVAPVLLGSAFGAILIAQVDDATFERLFGVAMLAMLVPVLRGSAPAQSRRWPAGVRPFVFFAIGLYGGALQAGVGIPLLFALSYAGHDLVKANSVKVVLIFAVTAVAIPFFVLGDQIAWGAAGALAVGFLAGGALGASLAVRAGETAIRPVLALAVLALAGRMLGLY